MTYSLALGLGINQLLSEGLPISILARILHHNLRKVVVQLVHDVLDFFVQLQLVEFLDALRRDGYTIPVSAYNL